MRIWSARACIILSLMLLSCNRHGFFYYPNKIFYNDPEKRDIPYEFLRYPSKNKKNLYALLFLTRRTPKGIVVHFHGNFGNISNHFPESLFLTHYGYDVLIFDYQGYGGSDGIPSPKNMVDDGMVTVGLAAARNRGPKGSVAIFGQSLGAAVGAVVASRDKRVNAIVLESGFTSYRSMARAVIRKNYFLWPLYPFYPFLLSRKYDPIDTIPQISPRPLLIIHGTADEIVPAKMSQILFDRAKDPKELWLVDGSRHLEIRVLKGLMYEKKISEFLDQAFKNTD